MRVIFSLIVGLCFVGLVHCGGDSTSDTATETTGLRLDTAADFESSASAALSARVAALTTGTCDDIGGEPTAMDDPVLTDGLDCDGDGGVAAHVTPSQYTLAFKRITLLSEDGNGDIDLLADTGTLAQSEAFDFTGDDSSETIVTVDPSDLAAGTYTGLEVEIYYFQLTFSVAGVERNVRIYMSDDDFATEGSLGHHQGDIIFVDAAGTELGWVDSTWTSDNLASERGDEQNGAGGTDAETGHDRGFFGDSNLWDSDDLAQGADQDIYVATLTFDEALEIPDPSTITDLTTITATFSVADTFYYEDFAPQNTEAFPGFYPAEGGEAADDGAEWAPLVPVAELTVE